MLKPWMTCANVSLRLGDCIEVLERWDGPPVDVVVTSPPYNLGVRYSRYDDRIERQEYLEWLERWARALNQVLAENGSLFLNLGAKPTDPWVPYDVLARMRELFQLQNVIHWIKSIAIEKHDVGNYGVIRGDVAVGHYKPINSSRFLNDCHEFVFHLTRTGSVPLDRLAVGVPYQDESNIRRWSRAGGGKRCRGNTWFVPYKTIQWRDKDRPHPATFPVELARKCLLLHGLRDDLVAMDPFLGIGHAALAAVQLGVRFYGVELDPTYYEVACREVVRAQGGQDAFESAAG
ncbi:MAG: site-specific DNA-methyltransferase [Armatimonadetes bacterium]|nr:site-specific DNA-methyltransferase [Armatimonadota bacterium]